MTTDDLDFSKVRLPDFPKTRVDIGSLPDLIYAKFRVAAKLNKKSLMQNGQTAIITYVRRNWPEHFKELQVEATRRGITPEECFIQLLEEDMK